MKINKTLTALIAGASLGLSGQAFAAGTTAGTPISNTVSLSFTVGSDSITATPDTAVFNVDTKVNLSLDWQDGALVTGTAGVEVAFELQISNTGNDVQNFKFSSGEFTNGNDVTAGNADSDEFGTLFTFYADTNSSGGYNTGDVALTSNTISGLAVDTPTTVFAVVTVPTDALDLAVIGAELMAQAVDGSGDPLDESLPGDDKNTNLLANYVVFAEATSDSALTLAPATTRDGAYVVSAGTDVQAANLVIEKTIAITNDGLTSSAHAASPKAIPGATVQYTITVENRGRVAASLVRVVDDLTANANLDASAVDVIGDLAITGGGNAVTSNAMAASLVDVTFTSLAAKDATDGSGPDFVQIVFEATIQ